MRELSKENKDRLKRVISNTLCVDIANISDDSEIRNDLGADSLDEIELIIDIETEFCITISDDDSEKITKVSDFYDILSLTIN